MSAEDLSTLTTGLKTQLRFLNNTYLQDISQDVFGGSNNDMDILKDVGTNAIFSVKTYSTSNTVSLFTPNSYGSPVAITNRFTTIIDTTNISEINCLSLLDNSTDSTKVKNYMYGLYALYAILNTSYFDNFILSIKENKPFSPLQIPIYETTTLVMTDITTTLPYINGYLNYIDPNLITNIYNLTNFNVFIARRIVYMWILMYNFRIAYKYYLNNVEVSSENLALSCLQILKNNNKKYAYNSPLDNDIQSSSTVQTALLKYQMWQIILQLLVPDIKADFTTLDLGAFTIKKPFTCTALDPQHIIDQLDSIFTNLYINYSKIKDTDKPSYVKEFTALLNSIKVDSSCEEDSFNNTLSIKIITTMNTAKTQMDIDKTVNDDAYAALKTAQARVNTAKREVTTASTAVSNAFKNISTNQEAAIASLRTANNMLTIANNTLSTAYTKYINAAKIYHASVALYTSAESLSTTNSLPSPTTSILLQDLLSETKRLYTNTQSYLNRATIPAIDLNIDPLNPLKNSINNSITKYRNNQTEINSLAPVLNKNKETLKKTQTQFKSRQDRVTRLNIYKYIELSIMILITIFAFVIISVPFEKSMKTLLTSILALVAIANILIIYYVFDKPGLIETFTISQPNGLNQDNTDISIAVHQFMDASIRYLLQTDNLNILLQSKMVYGNVNQGLSKELTYYNDASTELVNSNINIDSVYKSAYITQINYSAAMQLFMSLSLIVAGFTISFVTLESLEITGSVYTWVSSITAFFIIIVVIIYMLEVSTRVRTNPKQVYWAVPTKRLE